MSEHDRSTQRIRGWLRASTPTAPDAERSVDEVMTTLLKQTRTRPRLSFRFLRGRGGGEGGYSMFSALKLGAATAVIALVGGMLAVGVLPQEQSTPVPAAPTESASPEVAIEDLPPSVAVTGKMKALDDTRLATQDPDHPGPGTLWHDWAWDLSIEVDDPRLNGLYRTNQDYMLFEGTDDYSGSLRTVVGTVENEGGSWTSVAHGFNKPRTSLYQSGHYVAYFSGEGGYEGLSAMLLVIPAGSYWALDGVIGPGPLPEPPASVSPPAAE